MASFLLLEFYSLHVLYHWKQELMNTLQNNYEIYKFTLTMSSIAAKVFNYIKLR